MEDLILECRFRVDNIRDRESYKHITEEQALSVAAFDVKLPDHFALCVALSAAFAGMKNTS